jgi:hypothetical protein
MMSVSKDLEWLSRQTTGYHSYMDDAMGMVEELDELGYLGRDLSSMDNLEKIDIGDGVIPRPTYVRAHICKCTSKRERKTGNNQVVEGIHVLFCLGLDQDAWVKQGAHRTSAID